MLTYNPEAFSWKFYQEYMRHYAENYKEYSNDSFKGGLSTFWLEFTNRLCHRLYDQPIESDGTDTQTGD